MGIGATLGAAMLAFALLGVVAAAARYFVVPWERVVDAEEAPEGVPVVRLTRAGTTLGALSLVTFAVGGWLSYAGTMAGLTVRDAEPTLAERVALVLPGDLVAAGSVVVGLLAVFAPVWVSVAVVARRSAGGMLTEHGE